METEFIYYRHITPVGIKVEEITGYEQKSGKVWLELAKQVYCENGAKGYRFLEHFPSGVPFLAGESSRISLSHTNHILVVATLPNTPEADLSNFSPRTALGIDVEAKNRSQVLKIREKFLSETEMKFVAEDDVKANIIAWTAKEAIYKAALIEGLEFKNKICLNGLPKLGGGDVATACVLTDEGEKIDFNLFSYESEGYIITLAFSPKCATFKKRR